MISLHHVNLGVPIGLADTESEFLVGLLGYRVVELSPDDSPEAKWFQSEDGKQIHLSEDADHRPAARAHVAVDLGDDLAVVERKLADAGYEYRTVDRPERRTVLCQDPAGNRWELRGTLP
jgi:catechol 2,3-dioxygenase-like lactoylglutathione lyase family enzyme